MKNIKFKSYKIYKKKNYIIIKTPIIKYKKTKLDKELSNNYQIIDTFINTIRKKSKKKNLSLLYNNLKTLKIIKEEDISNEKGAYNIKNNSIIIRKNSIEIIIHELLHLASSYYDKDKDFGYCGFSQTNKNQSIGNGINEGYTECLRKKLFPTNDKTIAYPYQELISEKIEMIIGEEKMTNLYLTADLKGLIEELSKYSDYQSVYKFITDLDFMLKYCTSEKTPSKNTRFLMLLKTNQILLFLFKIYIEKIIISKKIPQNKKNLIILSFINDMPDILKLYNHKYKLNKLNILKKLI